MHFEKPQLNSTPAKAAFKETEVSISTSWLIKAIILGTLEDPRSGSGFHGSVGPQGSAIILSLLRLCLKHELS